MAMPRTLRAPTHPAHNRLDNKTVCRLISTPESLRFGHLPSAHGLFNHLGCGDGRLTAELAEQFPSLVFVGMDVNADAVATARAEALGARPSGPTVQIPTPSTAEVSEML